MLPAVLSPLSRTGVAARATDTAAAGGARPSARRLDEANRAVAALRAERPELARLSSPQLFDRASGILERWAAPLLADHTALTAAARDSAALVRTACVDLGQPDLPIGLLGPLGGLDSAEPAWAMWRLGRLVADSAELTRAFDQGTDELPARLVGGAPDGALFLVQFDELLHRFGAQGPNDWDLASPTWETHPNLAVAAIDLIRSLDDDETPAVRHARLAAHRRATIPVELHATVEAAGRLLAARERSKTTLARMLHEVRMPCYEIGRRMVEQGYLDRIADFGMVTFEEFPAFLDDPESFGLMVRERRAEHEGRAAALPAPAAPDGGTLTGVPASPGRVTGAVRLVTNPADPGDLRPGDIAVAPAADPSWLPLFLPAGAIVVEVGDWLSHTAVVSRELGIPGVFGCAGATVHLPDGGIVTVDGAAGTVTIHAAAGV